jgi:hypothetical protein
MKTGRLLWIGTGLAVLLSACATTTLSANDAPKLDLSTSWVLLPSINNTETPQAGGRLDSIAASLVRARGINLSMYSTSGQDDDTFNWADRRHQDQALERAGKQGYHYAIAGSVNEWRYKVGVEGEPVASISMSVIDVSTGKTIWSGSAARTGSTDYSVSAMAQELVNQMLDKALANSAAPVKYEAAK